MSNANGDIVAFDATTVYKGMFSSSPSNHTSLTISLHGELASPSTIRYCRIFTDEKIDATAKGN